MLGGDLCYSEKSYNRIIKMKLNFFFSILDIKYFVQARLSVNLLNDGQNV